MWLPTVFILSKSQGCNLPWITEWNPFKLQIIRGVLLQNCVSIDGRMCLNHCLKKWWHRMEVQKTFLITWVICIDMNIRHIRNIVAGLFLNPKPCALFSYICINLIPFGWWYLLCSFYRRAPHMRQLHQFQGLPFQFLHGLLPWIKLFIGSIGLHILWR